MIYINCLLDIFSYHISGSLTLLTICSNVVLSAPILFVVARLWLSGIALFW